MIRSQPELARASLLTLVSENEERLEFWNYALNADGKGPMLQFLLRNSNTVRIPAPSGARLR